MIILVCVVFARNLKFNMGFDMIYVLQRDGFSAVKKCAISVALTVGLITGAHSLGWPEIASAKAIFPALPDVSVLISGPPIKDPGALLRYALPIDNKAIREVQKPLEDITESLKIASVKALDSVERVRNLNCFYDLICHLLCYEIKILFL